MFVALAASIIFEYETCTLVRPTLTMFKIAGGLVSARTVRMDGALVTEPAVLETTQTKLWPLQLMLKLLKTRTDELAPGRLVPLNRHW